MLIQQASIPDRRCIVQECLQKAKTASALSPFFLPLKEFMLRTTALGMRIAWERGVPKELIEGQNAVVARRSTVLIVDDEKNMRTTLAHALESIGLDTETAATADEALEKLSASPFDLMLLDLWLPEVDGLELLRRAREMRPETRVVVVTAHGTVEAAVRAMKLGALDFVQKPFSPDEIRDVVRGALAAEPPAGNEGDYGELVAEARRELASRRFETAMPYLRKAIAADPGRPEAFNLLGVATALRGKTYRAQDYFRASLALDPTYAPALTNLERCGTVPPRGELLLGEDELA